MTRDILRGYEITRDKLVSCNLRLWPGHFIFSGMRWYSQGTNFQNILDGWCDNEWRGLSTELKGVRTLGQELKNCRILGKNTWEGPNIGRPTSNKVITIKHMLFTASNMLLRSLEPMINGPWGPISSLRWGANAMLRNKLQWGRNIRFLLIKRDWREGSHCKAHVQRQEILHVILKTYDLSCVTIKY